MGQELACKTLQEERSQLVVKSNELIQKSRFNLSTSEQKIILYLISKIKPSDTEFHEYEFSVADFCKICGISSQSGSVHAAVKQSVKTLADKSFWLKQDDGVEVLLRWLQHAKIENGRIHIQIDQNMKPYLLQLREKFTRYELIYTLAFKSQFSIRLYEILKSYQWRHEVILVLEELKQSMFAENYKNFKDFRNRVLDVAVREINQYSDITVEYQPITKGRKTVSLLFRIKDNGALERVEAYSNCEEVLDGSRR